MLTQDISTDVQCLNDYSTYFFDNISTDDLFRMVEGNLTDDHNTNFDNDYNLPRNFACWDLRDSYTFDFIEKIQNATGGVVKLSSYYEDGDFLGWHTNSGASGYNLILTYSDSTDSYLQIRNSDGTFSKSFDTLGWKIRKNHFDGNTDWHRVICNGNRLTFALLFDNETERDDAITELQSL